ncbi:MAG TPA: hypothetical protein VJH03_07085 [Blastocatellia bacterium]|nr:hypothetical protein [Blastocatellia bacterium]
MADDNDYSSIGPLNAAAQKDAWPLVGMFVLAVVITCVTLWVVGFVLNQL